MTRQDEDDDKKQQPHQPDAEPSTTITTTNEDRNDANALVDAPPTADDQDTQDTKTRDLFSHLARRQTMLKQRITGFLALKQRLTTYNECLQEGYKASKEEMDKAETTITRLQEVREQLEKRFQDILEVREAEMKAAMERRTAISAELQETIVKVQQEETRVREEKMALLTRKEALKAELREELSLIEKQTAKHEATNKAAAAEEARYKAQLEELDEAIAAMTADINENNEDAERQTERVEALLKELEESRVSLKKVEEELAAKEEEQRQNEEKEASEGGEGGIVTSAEVKALNKRFKELNKEAARERARRERQEKAYGDAHIKETKAKKELEEVETKVRRIEDLITTLKNEDAVLTAKILSASQ